MSALDDLRESAVIAKLQHEGRHLADQLYGEIPGTPGPIQPIEANAGLWQPLLHASFARLVQADFLPLPAEHYDDCIRRELAAAAALSNADFVAAGAPRGFRPETCRRSVTRAAVLQLQQG